MAQIRIITTGGTIDKVYFDAMSEYQVGTPAIRSILAENGVTADYMVDVLLQKDSLELTDEDRRLIRQHIERSPEDKILVTHGTDTMIQTALAVKGIPSKTVVLTGSLQPAGFRSSDATFNVGCALGALQSLPPGVYVVMNGRVFDPERSRKNRGENRFEDL